MVKELLVILISSSLVNNVVLSQFLGLCPFLGVSKKTDTATGMGVDNCIYSCDCGVGAVRRNVPQEIYAILVPIPGRLSSSDHNKLCGAWRGAYQCTEELWHYDRNRKWICHGSRIYGLNRDPGGYQREINA